MVIGSFPGELRAARGTKGKTGSGGCSLPSDKLTLRELAKMNGKVTSVTLRPGLSWTAFCSLPDHLQKEYLEAMLSHDATSVTLSEMFRISQSSLYHRAKSLGVVFPQYNGYTNKKKRESWEAYCQKCAEQKEEKLNELKEKEETKVAEVKTEIVKNEAATSLKSGRLCFEGRGDEIARLLAEVLPGGEIEVEVNFRALDIE